MKRETAREYIFESVCWVCVYVLSVLFSEELKSGKRTSLTNDLDTRTIVDDFLLVSETRVLSSGEIGETPLVRSDDFLSTREFSLGSLESFHGELDVSFLDSDGEQNGSDVNTGSLAECLTEGSSHTSLESICTSAWKHFVDSEHVPRVNSASQVESILGDELNHILVGSNTCGFECLRGNLLLFIGDNMHNVRELFDTSFLFSGIVDTNSWIRHTSVVSGFRVWLTLGLSVTSSRSSSHFSLDSVFFLSFFSLLIQTQTGTS